MFSFLNVSYNKGDKICMSRSQVYEWLNRFKRGHESVESDELTGRPVIGTMDRNVELVQAAAK